MNDIMFRDNNGVLHRVEPTNNQIQIDNDGNIYIWNGETYQMARECLKCKAMVLPKDIKNGICNVCRGEGKWNTYSE